MDEFFNSLGEYISESQFDSFSFWVFPLGTLLSIWILTLIGLKVFSNRNQLKTIFVIHKAWIISSLLVNFVLIALISCWWANNYFAHNPIRFSLLLSVFISLIIPVIILVNLKNFFTQKKLKEIINQPKSEGELNNGITIVKQAYDKVKLYYILPLLSFIFLFCYLNKESNLISIVYDNSTSMTESTAIDAISETFESLDQNNEIVLTTLSGYSNDSEYRFNLSNIISANQSADLIGGEVQFFYNPISAKNGLNLVDKSDFSPISEAIWKTILSINERNIIQDFDNRLLIVITDGGDLVDYSETPRMSLFDDDKFINTFSTENVFIIDYSPSNSSDFMDGAANAGCDIYPAQNKQDYLDALDNALLSFKSDANIIYWTMTIFIILTAIGLFIKPNKII